MKINANRRRSTLGSDPFDALVPENAGPEFQAKTEGEGPEDSSHVPLADGAVRSGARRGLLDTRPYSLQPVRSRSAIRNRQPGAEAGRSLPKAGGRSQGRPACQDLPMRRAEKERTQ